MTPLKEIILEYLRAHPDRLPDLREIIFHVGRGSAERHRIKKALAELVDAGHVTVDGRGRYRLAVSTKSVTGRLSLHRDGYGFVTPDGGGDDIFVAARYLRECLHGDLIEVSVSGRGREGKREGRLVRILERGVHTVVGTLQVVGRSVVLTPQDERAPVIRIEGGMRGGAHDGQMAVAEIIDYPAGRSGAVGRITDVLGDPKDPAVEILAIIKKHGLPDSFPPDVLAEARRAPQDVPVTEYGNRTDLRSLTVVTIDGETARDFDDAVSVRREGTGGFRLWVSIADVSHYVRPGSPLDREAYLRGTSVYFPDRCLPMLPEELSNGICSLNPEVERLTMTAEILFDKSGRVAERHFYPSIIRSSARLTYTIVSRILVDHDPELTARHHGLIGDLQTMEQLARLLMARRRERGSIDFDLPEPEIVLNMQGGIDAIVRSERTLAHHIIEEFMLAANEAVASFIAGKEIPSLYRIHETPGVEKLRDFQEFLHNLGFEFPLHAESIEPGTLQKLLDVVAGRPEERMVNQVLLRSMKQARYSAENVGHFGLASPCYTHFTSPIRRYPDLVVHRVLRKVLAGTVDARERDHLASTLPDVADQTSARERTAMEAEREVIELKKAEFMEDKVGEEFTGIVSGVTSFGLFVELTELFVEGLVHISSLPPDRYLFNEKEYSLTGARSGLRYRLGDQLRIRVAKASRERRQVDFVLADHPLAVSPAVSPGEEYPRIPVRGKRPRFAPGERESGRHPGKRKGGRGRRHR